MFMKEALTIGLFDNIAGRKKIDIWNSSLSILRTMDSMAVAL